MQDSNKQNSGKSVHHHKMMRIEVNDDNSVSSSAKRGIADTDRPASALLVAVPTSHGITLEC